MNKTCSALLLCFLFIFMIAAAEGVAGQVESVGNVTVFIYHKFGEDQYPTTNVAVNRFDEQMAFLKDNGYQVISLKRLSDLLKQGKPLPDKTVVITIDDGYSSTYTAAWPIFKKYGFPFTVFVYVKAVDSGYSNFLTWEQIKEMQEAGVDFQDHSYSHHRFGTIPKGLDQQSYKEWIQQDLKKGRAILSEHLGYEPQFLALPYGEYNETVIEIAEANGYQMVLSQDPGSVSRYSDVMALPREPILGNDWATMRHFETVLDRVDLPFKDMEPKRQPLLSTPEKFCATLLAPEAYQQSSLGIYVSEFGWQPATLKNKRLCIDNLKALERRFNRVAISAKEKESGRQAIRYWLLFQ